MGYIYEMMGDNIMVNGKIIKCMGYYLILIEIMIREGTFL